MIHIHFLQPRTSCQTALALFFFRATPLAVNLPEDFCHCSHIYMAASPYCSCVITFLDLLWCATINKVHFLAKQRYRRA